MSVALRTITRLQDADDINVTLGVGVDEYALCWDNDTAKFVLRAIPAVVTDHGALTGLSDDDHSQYLLATGSRTGASAAAQPFTVGISLTDTTTATTGVIFKGTDRFIHDFHHPTGNTAIPTGQNTFVGINAGNFTIGSTATQAFHGSSNVGVGFNSLRALTTGYGNMAFGENAMFSTNTGYFCVGIGQQALYKLTGGSYNVAIGRQSMFEALTSTACVAIGESALRENTASGNTAIGSSALRSNTTGANNVGIGNNAGRYHADGSTALADPENSVYIGHSSRGKDNSDSNSIVIGYTAIGLGANTTVIGNTSTTAATIYGAGAFPLVSAATNTVSNLLTLTHDTSGTAAAGFGAGQLFQLESSTTAAQDAARIQALWYEATHATRKADLVLTAYDTAEREGLRIRGAGSAPALGFYGVSPIERATLATGAGASVDDVITALQNLGLVKQS